MRVQNLPFRCHSFELACADLDIEHRLTKPRHPWTNGQVEPMNRTIREATVKRYYYETHDQLRHHLTDFVGAYNFTRRLKTLRGLTPYKAIYKAWTDDPSRFISNLHHQSLALLWQSRLGGHRQRLMTVRALRRRWSCHPVEDCLPDGWQGRLRGRSADSFFSAPRP